MVPYILRPTIVLLVITATLLLSPVDGQRSNEKQKRHFNEIPDDPVVDGSKSLPSFGSLFSMGEMLKGVIRRINRGIEYCARIFFGQLLPYVTGRHVTRHELNEAVGNIKKYSWGKIKTWKLLEDYFWIMDMINFDEIHEINDEL